MVTMAATPASAAMAASPSRAAANASPPKLIVIARYSQRARRGTFQFPDHQRQRPPRLNKSLAPIWEVLDRVTQARTDGHDLSYMHEVVRGNPHYGVAQ